MFLSLPLAELITLIILGSILIIEVRNNTIENFNDTREAINVR